jgi:murein DD-endopeptidase MepM/ murein hydrolase activator NlpD
VPAGKTPPAKAAAAKTAAAKPAAAKAAPVKSATAKTATAKTATGKTSTAKAAVAKAPVAKAPVAKAAVSKTSATPAARAEKPAPARRSSTRPRPKPAPAVDTPAVDTPAESPVVEDVTLATAGATTVEEPAAEVVEPRRSWLRRLPLRRRGLVLAAALVAALSISTVVSRDLAAQAETPQAVSESVSVARALGIESQSSAELSPELAGVRLEELVASRAERNAEQTAAAQAQSRADKEEQQRRSVAAEAARPKAVVPVNGARLTSTFGPRWGTLHAGIDLAAPMLTPEYAAADGVVLEAGPASGYGLAVYIQHANGDVTVYGHMEEILVQPGQVVRAGDTIARLGNRGQSTGPHLHFEVHVGGVNGTKIDPLPWLRQRGVHI